jgi:cob(I)alamin adenosyltransferase
MGVNLGIMVKRSTYKTFLSLVLACAIAFAPTYPFAAEPELQSAPVSQKNVVDLAGGADLAYGIVDDLKKRAQQKGVTLDEYRIVVNYYGSELADLPSQLSRFMVVLKQNGINNVEFRHVSDQTINDTMSELGELNRRAAESAAKAWADRHESSGIEKEFAEFEEALIDLEQRNADTIERRIGRISERIFKYVLRLQVAPFDQAAQGELPVSENILRTALMDYDNAIRIENEELRRNSLEALVRASANTAQGEHLRNLELQGYITRLGNAALSLMDADRTGDVLQREKATEALVESLYELSGASLANRLDLDPLEFREIVEVFTKDLFNLTEKLTKRSEEHQRVVESEGREVLERLTKGSARLEESRAFIKRNEDLFRRLSRFVDRLESAVYSDSYEKYVSKLRDAIYVFERARANRQQDPEAYQQALRGLLRAKHRILEMQLHSYIDSPEIAKKVAEMSPYPAETAQGNRASNVLHRLGQFMGTDKVRWDAYPRLIFDQDFKVDKREVKMIAGLTGANVVLTFLILGSMAAGGEEVGLVTGTLTAAALRAGFSFAERANGEFSTQGLNWNGRTGYTGNMNFFLTTQWTHSIVYSMILKMAAQHQSWLGNDLVTASTEVFDMTQFPTLLAKLASNKAIWTGADPVEMSIVLLGIFAKVFENSVLGVIGKAPITEAISRNQGRKTGATSDSAQMSKAKSQLFQHGFVAVWTGIKFTHLFGLPVAGNILYVVAALGLTYRAVKHLKGGREIRAFRRVQDIWLSMQRASKEWNHFRRYKGDIVFTSEYKQSAREVASQDVKNIKNLGKKVVEKVQSIGKRSTAEAKPGIDPTGMPNAACTPIMISVLRRF